MRETWVNLREMFKSLPGRCFAYRNVRIAGLHGLAMRGVRDADRQARTDERIKNGDFGFLQRKRAVVTGDERAGGLQRIVLAENGVGRGDGRLGNGEAVVHVAEVDDAGNLSRLGP